MSGISALFPRSAAEEQIRTEYKTAATEGAKDERTFEVLSLLVDLCDEHQGLADDVLNRRATLLPGLIDRIRENGFQKKVALIPSAERLKCDPLDTALTQYSYVCYAIEVWNAVVQQRNAPTETARLHDLALKTFQWFSVPPSQRLRYDPYAEFGMAFACYSVTDIAPKNPTLYWAVHIQFDMAKAEECWQHYSDNPVAFYEACVMLNDHIRQWHNCPLNERQLYDAEDAWSPRHQVYQQCFNEAFALETMNKERNEAHRLYESLGAPQDVTTWIEQQDTLSLRTFLEISQKIGRLPVWEKLRWQAATLPQHATAPWWILTNIEHRMEYCQLPTFAVLYHILTDSEGRSAEEKTQEVQQWHSLFPTSWCEALHDILTVDGSTHALTDPESISLLENYFAQKLLPELAGQELTSENLRTVLDTPVLHGDASVSLIYDLLLKGHYLFLPMLEGVFRRGGLEWIHTDEDRLLLQAANPEVPFEKEDLQGLDEVTVGKLRAIAERYGHTQLLTLELVEGGSGEAEDEGCVVQ